MQPDSPYKGLRSFGDSELDAQLFFGRARETEVIAANLLAARLTVLFGPSGVGKSSVLGAGVAGRLRDAAENAVVVGFDSWQDDPVEGLRETIGAALGGATPRGTLAASLRDWTREADIELYLLLDQIEQHFVYHGRGRNGLGETLADVVNDPSLRVNVLLGIRDDALAQLDAFKTRLPRLFNNYLRLDHLDRGEARAAIEGPLACFGQLTGEEYAIEPELVESVLDQVAAGRIDYGLAGRGGVADGGGARIEAPFLQLVLERLWEAEREEGSRVLRLSTLERLGGAELIVREHLDGALGTLGSAEQRTAAELFNHLVTPSGTKIAHAPADLARYAGEDELQTRRVLEALAEQRIVRPVEEGRFEIFHDVLAGAVLEWRAQHEARLELARERRRRRRAIVVAGIALVALAFVAIAAVFALVQRSDARHQAALARRQSTVARQQAEIASSQRKEAQKQAAIARIQRKEAQKQAANARTQELRAKHEASIALVARRRAQEQSGLALQQRARAEQAARAAQTQRAKADRQAAIALTQRRRAQAAARRARSHALAESALARLAVDPEESVRLGVQAARIERSRLVANVLRRALTESHERAVLPARGPVVAAAYSPDGTRVVTASADGAARLYALGGRGPTLLHTLRGGGPLTAASFSPGGGTIVTASKDGSARLWSARTGALLYRFDHGGSVRSATFTADGRLVVTASLDHSIRLWQTDTGAAALTIRVDGPVDDARPSPDGALVAAIVHDPQNRITARLYDAHTGALVRMLDQRGVTGIAFSPDGSMLATTGSGAISRLWEVPSGAVLQNLPNGGTVHAPAFSPDGKLLATVGSDGDTRVFDVATGARLLILGGANNSTESVAFSPDSRFLVAASRDRFARVYGVVDGRVAALLAGHKGSVGDATFSPDGKRVLTASDDGTARIWDAGTASQLRLVGAHDSAVNEAVFSPDGRLAVSAGQDGTARIWDVRQRRLLETLRHGAAVNTAAFSPDGKLVVTASADGAARLWRVADGAELHALTHGAAVAAASFSRDGRLVITAGADGSARVWRVADGAQVRMLRADGPVTAALLAPGDRLALTVTGAVAEVWSGERLLHRLRGHADTVVAASFSPDGSTVLTASADGTARLWDARSGKVRHVLSGHANALTDAAFSRDGRRVVTTSVDRDARIWDARTGRLLQVLRGHFTTVNAAAFSPDGRWVVTGGQTTAIPWDATTGQLLYYLRGHTATITSVAFGPDGRTILTASSDHTVRTYRCDVCSGLPGLVRLAQGRLARLAPR